MGSRLNHSVGAINDNSNWFILGWSKTVGDLRVSPFYWDARLTSFANTFFYVFKNTKLTIGLSLIYGLLALVTLIQAFQGKPLVRSNKQKKDITNIIN